MKTTLTLVAVMFALSGCLNFDKQRDAPVALNYVLNDAAITTAVAVDKPKTLTLLVLDTTTGGFYDTEPLIFSNNEGTRGQYQFARWTERPGKRFADLLRTRLDKQSVWYISPAGGYVRGDFLLDTELIEFYHDATQNPGVLRLKLQAELVDLKRRSLLGRRVFEQQVALTTYDAAGAARASNVAVGRVLDELTDWLATFDKPLQ